MNDTVNRQVLLVEKPTGKLGPEHFKMSEASHPGAEGRRGLAAGALYFARRRQPGLDARRHLPRGGRGQYRDGRRRHRRSGVLESARSCAGRYRVRRYRLAGLRRRAGQAPEQDAEARADDASARASTASPASPPISACSMSASRRPARPSWSRPPPARSDRSSARSPRSRAAASSASPAARTNATG